MLLRVAVQGLQVTAAAAAAAAAASAEQRLVCVWLQALLVRRLAGNVTQRCRGSLEWFLLAVVARWWSGWSLVRPLLGVAGGVIQRRRGSLVWSLLPELQRVHVCFYDRARLGVWDLAAARSVPGVRGQAGAEREPELYTREHRQRGRSSTQEISMRDRAIANLARSNKCHCRFLNQP